MTTPPGSHAEQLPDDVLALLPYQSYLSTACQATRLIEVAIICNPLRKDLPGIRDRLHKRCRLNNKYLGHLCICHCHPAES